MSTGVDRYRMREQQTSDSGGSDGTLRIALNGFGRIGRNVLRASLSDDEIDLVAVNDVMDDDDKEYLFRYDSVFGRFDGVSRDGETLFVDDQAVQLLTEKDPSALPWDDLDIDIVFEATGLFRSHDEASQHLDAGAQKVIISAPATGDKPVPMFVYGVNHEEYDGQDVVSNSSCTTNSIAPVAMILEDEFGIESGLLTTVHAYTSSQHLIDGPSDKRTRGRAAAENIVPTTTGAGIAATEVLPELENKLRAMAIRVPVPNGSVTDLSVSLATEVTMDDIADVIRDAADGDLNGVLGYTDEEIVSRDIVGLPYAAYVDLEASMVEEGGLVKVLTWYDNEYGFSHQMIRLARYVAAETGLGGIEETAVP